MSPSAFLSRVIQPSAALVHEHCGIKTDKAAARFLLAVAHQESGLAARYQKIAINSDMAGPARGFWQFEIGGGVAGVLRHERTAGHVQKLCAVLEVEGTQSAIWRALEGNDMLAGCMARLLLWTDPKPVPTTQEDAWDCYLYRLWRPGKPFPAKWPRCWEAAGAAIESL